MMPVHQFRAPLRDAACRIIADLGLVPAFPIDGAVPAGTSSIVFASAADASLFRRGGIVLPLDGTGEFPAVVDHVSGSTVYLSFAGRYTSYAANATPITGFQHTHDDGALFATNLVPSVPNWDDPTFSEKMLANGYPVIYVYVADAVTNWPANATVQPSGWISVVYQLPLTQPHATTLDATLWLLELTDRADADLATFIAQLETNFTLTAFGSDNAEFVQRFMQAARQNLAFDSLPLFEDYLDIQVVGIARDPGN